MRKYNFALQILINYKNHYINLFSESINQFEFMDTSAYKKFCSEYGSVMVINNCIPFGNSKIRKPRYSIYLPYMCNEEHEEEGLDYLVTLIKDCLYLFQIDEKRIENVQEKICKDIKMQDSKHLMNYTIQIDERKNEFGFDVERYVITHSSLLMLYKNEELEDELD